MALENECRFSNGQLRADANKDARAGMQQEDEDHTASEGNKSTEKCEGEDVTMADYRFNVNNLFQSKS